MAKRPAYLPSSVKTVGAMIADGMHITWSCSNGHFGVVALRQVAAQRGPDFSLVGKQAPCREPGCKGQVHFRYAGGPGTPSRRLEALREGQDGASAADRAIDHALVQLKQLYNSLARLHGRPLLKD